MEGSRRAVITALLANLGIACAKGVGFVATGSASMAAEAVHSVADTANQVLLLVGQRRARRGPDELHPFGYGQEGYFWAFVVAVILFTGGGLFSLLEAEEKLRSPHEISSPGWAAGILVMAALLEGTSLRTAVAQSARERRGRSWRTFLHDSKQAELPVVLLEDSGALVGLGLALAGVSLATVTGDARWDALGSLGIGLLLVVIAVLLAREMKSLLIGEAAAPETVAAVRGSLLTGPVVDDVVELRMVHLGPEDLLVTARVRLRQPPTRSAEEAIAELEAHLKATVPSARAVFIVPVAP
jgi:cation diffusion facilitator family transporter